MHTGKVWRLNRAALFGLLTLSLLASVQAGSLPADAARSVVPPVALAASAAPRLPAAATRAGAVPSSQRIHFNVLLKVRDQAGLSALMAGLADRKSPYYHHILRKGQFGPLFGPTLGQVAAVQAALKAAGLRPGPVTADRLSIPVTATAAQVEHAFGTSLVTYRMPGGRVAFANATAPKIDASVAPLLSGIEGLDDLYPLQSASLHRASPADSPTRISRPGVARTAAPAASAVAPSPCAAASQESPFTMSYWANWYRMDPLYRMGDLGQGQRVALLELEPYLSSDISAFESCYGISTPVNNIPVDGGPGTGAGSGEAALDIEIVAGLAPQATIDVYQAPNTQTALDDAIAKFAGDDTDSVLSVSWLRCYLQVPQAVQNHRATLAVEAAAQGQTILAAAGDSGSSACLQNGTSVTSPANAPFLIAVGGTDANAPGGEAVWNDSTGASGGGIAGNTCMTAYQHQPQIPGILESVNGETTSLCQPETPEGFVRPMPDVSAEAAASSGYHVFYSGSWTGFGGTSGASPLWAAIAALTNASPYCAAYGSGNPGVLPSALYDMVARNSATVYGTAPQILLDITSGNNDWLPSGYQGGLYPATHGYDLASGLGIPLVTGIDRGNNGVFSPFIPGYAAAMCREMATQNKTWAVTGVGPSAGKAGLPITVTITGNGFLPVDGAEQVRITTLAPEFKTLATVPASCQSTTLCTATLPAEPAGTVVDVRVGVLNAGFSVDTPADRYTYTTAPLLSGISPAQGPAAGRNTVILGGVNLEDAQSVTFGGKPGTNVIPGSATLQVTAPPGTAGTTVPVVVTGPAGTSNSLNYTYVAVPHITSISPARGTANGGTKVTITGSNFIGVKSVTFGGKTGFSIVVSGTSSITVLTPVNTPGRTVKVVVTGAGGTSNSVQYGYT